MRTGGTGTAASTRGSGAAGLREWARDLALGARFATSGGRQGWLRTLLTAVGVALGVAVLLLAAAVPEIVRSQDTREEARSGAFTHQSAGPDRSEYSVLGKDANNRWNGYQLYGRLLQAEGSSPATPPGLDHIPGPGELAVSPALKKVLESPEGDVLRERLDGKVTAVIGDEGLLGPSELAFYKGADDLSVAHGATRVTKFGSPQDEQPMDPTLVLLVVVACAVLVMPVAIFIATAVRFGGEQRDARLAALRLVGADIASARRMAAGETLVGALIGLLLGGWFFLLGRAFMAKIELFHISLFPEDVTPGLPLGLLIAVGVPLTAVAVTIFALRGVAIEPLGLVRKSGQRKRRLLWRLVPPAGGAALLLPLAGSLNGGGSVNEVQVSSGVVLLLSGVVLLLPWLVERLVARLRGGPVSWQLATRRLQLSSGNASRAVSGITVAVAGAIALQLLFSVVQVDEERNEHLGQDKTQLDIYGPSSTLADAQALTAELRRTEGVTQANGYLQSWLEAKGKSDDGVNVTVGTCASLRKAARIGDCHDGDAFVVQPGKDEGPPVERGMPLVLNGSSGGENAKGTEGTKGAEGKIWRVPSSARTVEGITSPEGYANSGLLLTPSVLSEKQLASPSFQGWAVTERTDEALERLRTTVFHTDPAYTLWETSDQQRAQEIEGVQQAILAASTAVLLLIGASMTVSMLEQLRERKRQLSVLVAFGTKRSTLGASVLWQTAVPVVLGIGLAVVFGLGLGWVLLRMLDEAKPDWLVFLPAAGAGAAVIALVTVISLPFLWRMMRPDGLRTE
ncbi:FtsX-like permease family protein [Streptomyces marispadix]|uniref:ABC transporter permease n=1 Tax=Streptomyces marispadix TaxID=2922868 RepID=A0ABS9T1K7_9ACTN|nr:ABC transporter permease [Streptomyces marispadix]MCH6162323.1 ABC transporter permease [Streptomyces marispadix]